MGEQSRKTVEEAEQPAAVVRAPPVVIRNDLLTDQQADVVNAADVADADVANVADDAVF